MKMIRLANQSNTYLVEAKSLDILCMGGFDQALEKTLQNANSSIYLDFSEVEEVSSAILGILLHKKMKMRKKGVEIYLLNVSHGIERILKILNLSSLLSPSFKKETGYHVPNHAYQPAFELV